MIHFGTGGWRAVIGDEFTRANVRLLTQGLAHRILEEGTAEQGVVIGYDRRFLSDTAAWWAIEVLVGNGIRVTLIDRPSPTPTTMWTVRRLGAAYGMAVTASHNPALYNGIKIFLPGGRDADQAVTDELTASLRGLTDADVRSVEAHEARSSELVTIQRSINWYLDAIIDKLDTETIRHAHMHIVLDPMFGVSETSLQTILLTARCQVDVIHDRHDPLFGGRMPSPTEGTVTTLRNAVVESGADLGIATDGDADRLGIIDDTGAYLTPNQVLVLLYDYLLTRKGWSGPAVRNMSTTHLLDRVAAAHGQVCYEVPVGFKWISAKMAETGAVIGGESSGGLTVRGHIPGKDGVYAGWLIRGCADEGDVQRLPAAISIGTNPTFDDVPQRTVEAHVLGRADLNLYGEEVGVELVERLRPMLAFDGLDALLVQMRADIEDTARILGVPVPEPIRPEDVTAQ